MRKSKQLITKSSKAKLTEKELRFWLLSSEYVDKCKFSICGEFLQEKWLLEKYATIKRIEYSPLGSKFKTQTDIAKIQYQGLDKVYEFDGKINYDNKKQTLKKYNKQDIIYDL